MNSALLKYAAREWPGFLTLLHYGRGRLTGFGSRMKEQIRAAIVMTQPPLSSDRPRDNRPKIAVIPNHPLAVLAGKFEGEFWEATLKEMQRSRQQDQQEQEEVAVYRDAG
jgi:hypothetical protein